MDRLIYAIIVAGGSGTRMGSDTPKQFLELEGKAILQRSIEAVLAACPEARIITVLPAASISYWKDYCAERNFDVPQMLVAGGITRFHSVKNALAKIPDGALVAIHDGVRPLVSADLVRELLERAVRTGAVVPVLPATDTLICLDGAPDGLKDAPEVIDRTRVYSVQTPQVFFSEYLSLAYRQGYDLSFTDDASVLRKKEIPLSYVKGERFNIKITTPEDLRLARAILLLQE